MGEAADPGHPALRGRRWINRLCGPEQQEGIEGRETAMTIAGHRGRSTMSKKSLPLAKVYGLLEPGPVVLMTTTGPERPNIIS